MLIPGPATRLQVIPSALSEELCATACAYLRLKAEIGEMQLGDGHVSNSFASYGDLLMEVLLQRVQPCLEEATGVTLLPTHSYVRLYQHGDRLSPHTDRAACEFTMTITLGSDSGAPWPIFIGSADSAHESALAPGDGLLYPGAELEHWREPLAGEWQVQLTLHYVDALGPHAEWVFDKRPGLGRHRGTRRA